MSISLHRSGLSTVLTAITGSGSTKLAQGYAWPRRDLADASLQFPFWTLDVSQAGSGEQPTSAGVGGQNTQTIITRILLFDTYAQTDAQYAQFLTIVDTVLAELRKDANLRLGQGDLGCVWNKVVRYSTTFNTDSTPALLVATIECQGVYVLNRT